MNEVILSGLGILLALCGMTVLIFRRVSPIIVGPLAALLVTVMSGLPVLDSVTGTYVQGVGSFFVSYFMIFLLGNILGSLYQISGAAAKIGETVVRWFGAKNCMVACLISAALLSYGGINSFVIIFAIYPIALKLFEEADLPTYLLPGIVCGGLQRDLRQKGPCASFCAGCCLHLATRRCKRRTKPTITCAPMPSPPGTLILMLPAPTRTMWPTCWKRSPVHG